MFARASRRNRSSSGDRRPRAGLFSGNGFLRPSKREDPDDEEEDKMHPMSRSCSTDESEAFHDAKVRAENLEDYEPSELVHGLISESSSGTTSSSEETTGEHSLEQSVEQSIVYVESEEDDEVGVGGILQMGCMDGFFMPGRATAAKKSLVAINEKGEKELKFNMKFPIATSFRNEEKKEQSENRNTSNKKRVDADGRSATPSIASVLNCRPNSCRNGQDVQEALEGYSVSSIRQQPTMDPPAKVAGAEPSDQFESLMSLSHDGSSNDGSSNDEDSHSNIRTENLKLPTPTPPHPYSMHGQSPYAHGHPHPSHPHPMMPHLHQWHHHQNMYHPQVPQPVTINNTYDMLVVNGMTPQQQQHLGYGMHQNYWNYTNMHNPALGQHHRPIEPPAIEKLPSQILVQREDHTIGEDSSCLSYENVPVSNPSQSAMLYQRAQQNTFTRQHFGARVLQNSHQHPHINAPHMGQSMTIQGSFPTKTPPYNLMHRVGAGNQSRIVTSGSSSEDYSHQEDSDDDFQDSVQVLQEDEIASKTPRGDEKSHSSSEGGKPQRVQRWKEANLRRLRGPSPSPPTTNKPPLFPTIPSTGTKETSPSFDEAAVQQQMEEDTRASSSIDVAATESNRDDFDDDETVDSEMAIVDTQNIQEKIKESVKRDPERLQPVQEEESTGTTDDGSTDNESTSCDDSSSTQLSLSAPAATASSLPLDEEKGGQGTTEEVSTGQETVEEEVVESSAAADKFVGDDQLAKPGSFLMFDSIYTRRRERRDAAKLKMNKFLESKKTERRDTRDEEELDANRSTLQLSRLGRITSRPVVSVESVNASPTPQQQLQNPLEQQNSLTATPQRDNKKANPPANLEISDDTDGDVLDTPLDVPSLSSPSKRTIRGPESPSKRVSMSPLARTSSYDFATGIKNSLSLKPTMTSEFHDAVSTDSDEISSSFNQSLRIQPTMTSEWHDAMQSPTSASVATAVSKHNVFITTAKDESLPPQATTKSVLRSKLSQSSSDEESSSVDMTLKKRSSDHDEYFEATCVVD
ncbi:hypothetical protein IV203_035141 [Nitzschia inconspicua]|uniref:Uncharacterized protein n=1 Tax=Nitzschia inconspicua TaxID=303405 RepID=A0A9K3PUJ0_9STRA|nr:hypothetical protein IV203_035141 [Nitzschia inconspicua]